MAYSVRVGDEREGQERSRASWYGDGYLQFRVRVLHEGFGRGWFRGFDALVCFLSW